MVDGLDINIVFMPGKIVGQDGAGPALEFGHGGCLGNKNDSFYLGLTQWYIHVVVTASSNARRVSTWLCGRPAVPCSRRDAILETESRPRYVLGNRSNAGWPRKQYKVLRPRWFVARGRLKHQVQKLMPSSEAAGWGREA